MADLPHWREGKPDKPGTYVGYSALPEREMHEKPSLYAFNGEVFQHWTGWYDHGVTHWMPTDLPDAQGDVGSSKPERDA